MAGAMSQAEVQQLGSGTSHPFIVIMKNQLTGAEALNDQAAIRSELGQVRAQRIKQFKTVNSLAATVTEAEAAHLRPTRQSRRWVLTSSSTARNKSSAAQRRMPPPASCRM